MHNALTIFQTRLPRRPYCSNDPTQGLVIRPTATALQHKHLQPNAPLEVGWLVFDIDYRGAALAWERANLPPPTATVINPANGHAHLFYGLNTPVVTSDAGRAAPLRFAAAVQAAYIARLHADPGYAGLIAKNPFHAAWITDWVNHLYDLAELAEYVELPKRLPKRAEVGLGRHCTLFDDLRAWAYTWVREYKRNGASFEQWQAAALGQAQLLNDFPSPLAFGDVKATARSVARWTWTRFSDEAFSAIQSVRGRRGGRPATTTLNGEPWADLGISRSTYYRRLNGGLLVPESTRQ
nr:replication initiation protein [Burkholderia gladioli]